MSVSVPSLILFPLPCAGIFSFLLHRSRVSAVLFLCAACALLMTAGPALAETAEEINERFHEESVDEIILTGDVDVLMTNLVCDDHDVTLDLNGHTINFWGSNSFSVSGGVTLTITDSSEEQTGMILNHIENTTGISVSGENSALVMSGGVISGYMWAGINISDEAVFTMNGGKIIDNQIGVNVNDGGSFIMNGGEITNNRSGGVYVSSGTREDEETYEVIVLPGGSFTMNGGEITGNNAGSGGGVQVTETGSFIMNGGKITGNNAGSGGGAAVDKSGSFTMNGGEISGNTAVQGGGVHVTDEGSFTMNGGEITGNNAGYGGGVNFEGASFNLSGGKISGNYRRTGDDLTDNNLRLKGGRVITVTGTLSGTGKMGVTMDSPGVFTTGLSDHGSPSFFFSDDPVYTVELTTDGEAQLVTRIPGDLPPATYPDPVSGINFFRIHRDFTLPATGLSALHPAALSEQPKDLRYEPVRMRLMIPSLDVDSELVTVPQSGDSWAVEWLGDRTGILEGSALPGEGLCAAAAHNTLNDEEFGPFALLGTLELNSLIAVSGRDSGLRTFRVFANELLAPDDMEKAAAIAEREENTLVLITCENESAGGGYLNRRVVFAKPVL